MVNSAKNSPKTHQKLTNELVDLVCWRKKSGIFEIEVLKNTTRFQEVDNPKLFFLKNVKNVGKNVFAGLIRHTSNHVDFLLMEIEKSCKSETTKISNIKSDAGDPFLSAVASLFC